VSLGAFIGCGNGGGGGGASTPNKGGPGAKRLTGGGSSFVAPMMKKWAAVYPQNHGVEIDYTSSGSGNGVSQMVDQKNDFGCTDAPMNEEQMKQAAAKGGDVIHVPVVLGAVVPFYNLTGVDKPLKFTGPILADIYLGNIKKWNEKPLADLNPDVKLPDLPITVARRADASGTSFIFTDYLSRVSPAWKEKIGASTQPKWPVGAGAVKSDGVAGLVSGTPGAIGYVELDYALNKKGLSIGMVQNAEEQFIEATPESVTVAAAGLKDSDISDDLRQLPLNNVKAKGAYPICGTTWMVLYVKQPADKVEPLKTFAKWVTHEGQDMTKDLHYARVPKSIVDRAAKKIDTVTAK
jgi:phosphate transport system substrate-binding protein